MNVGFHGSRTPWIRGFIPKVRLADAAPSERKVTDQLRSDFRWRASGISLIRVSRGRLTDAHDEVLYVIRKPEDRFARVV